MLNTCCGIVCIFCAAATTRLKQRRMLRLVVTQTLEVFEGLLPVTSGHLNLVFGRVTRMSSARDPKQIADLKVGDAISFRMAVK